MEGPFNIYSTIEIRKELMDEWSVRGFERDKDYAILTNEMKKAWRGLTVKEYKAKASGKRKCKII